LILIKEHELDYLISTTPTIYIHREVVKFLVKDNRIGLEKKT
jgi:hypothetical protein